MATTPLSMEEFRALAAIAGARRQIMVNMFSGTQLKFGKAASGRIKGDKSNTLDFAVVDCLFWAASGAKCRFESELFGVASCHDSEPKARPRTTEAYTDSSSFFVKARFTRVTQSFDRGIGLAQIIRMRHSQPHRRKSDSGCFHD